MRPHRRAGTARPEALGLAFNHWSLLPARDPPGQPHPQDQDPQRFASAGVAEAHGVTVQRPTTWNGPTGPSGTGRLDRIDKDA